MIFADFESTLVLENNGKQNPNIKYQKHGACSYNFKLVCVNDRFSKFLNL